MSLIESLMSCICNTMTSFTILRYKLINDFFFFDRFILASFYTKYDPMHFLINLLALLLITIPKFPAFHGVRIFGINKY